MRTGASPKIYRLPDDDVATFGKEDPSACEFSKKGDSAIAVWLSPSILYWLASTCSALRLMKLVKANTVFWNEWYNDIDCRWGGHNFQPNNLASCLDDFTQRAVTAAYSAREIEQGCVSFETFFVIPILIIIVRLESTKMRAL
jgi:hypothetical protein